MTRAAFFSHDKKARRRKLIETAGSPGACVLLFILTAAIHFLFPPHAAAAEQTDAERLVSRAVAYYRGNASYAVIDMTIHRPAWERTLTLKGWTRGQKDSLIAITAPPKDEGNGTLKKGREMWTYNPKVNRVIKLPPSMMSQAWMGSDFSNNDLAKSDSIVADYTHAITDMELHEGKKAYVVTALPKPDAPVVWGMQKLLIREDLIFLREEFYDEDMKLVKVMTGDRIRMLGGKLFPVLWKMSAADRKDEYTVLEYRELRFLDGLPESLFTLTALKNPRR
jgi:outer membrane lipoprotein-sorting protein